MIEIKILSLVGDFAENKDFAQEIRLKKIIPELTKGGEVILDFEGVDSATQSFIHALISGAIRKFGVEILDKISFKNCNLTVQKIINMVTDYMQEGA